MSLFFPLQHALSHFIKGLSAIRPLPRARANSQEKVPAIVRAQDVLNDRRLFVFGQSIDQPKKNTRTPNPPNPALR